MCPTQGFYYEMAFNQQMFDYDCSIPLKLNNLSLQDTYIIHHIYIVVSMEIFLVASTNRMKFIIIEKKIPMFIKWSYSPSLVILIVRIMVIIF